MMRSVPIWKQWIVWLALLSTAGCASSGVTDVYHAEDMDFGSIQTVAILPFVNLTKEPAAGERVRDVFMTMLLATGSVYVVPSGEVARGITLAGVSNPASPSSDDVKKLAATLKSDVILTGVLREYGDIRQTTTSASIISMSLQMRESQTGRVVWTASSTQGGIGMKERLLGGAGKPFNVITEKAVNDILDKLFK